MGIHKKMQTEFLLSGDCNSTGPNKCSKERNGVGGA